MGANIDPYHRYRPIRLGIHVSADVGEQVTVMALTGRRFTKTGLMFAFGDEADITRPFLLRGGMTNFAAVPA
jgi:hypothetical protein